MASVRLGENIGVREEVIKKASSLAMKAHKSPEKLYLSEKIRGSGSSEVVFSFPGSWSVHDWIRKGPFGEVMVDLELFPSLKYVGLNEVATVNEAFLLRFKFVLANSHFKSEVAKAVTDRKQVVFTGHSSGGPVAVFAAIWFLEQYKRPDLANKVVAPLCITFGSPLVGDWILAHALRRENWSRYFVNVVMRYDIVPRISLTPLSSIEQQLQQILSFFNPKSPILAQELGNEALGFFVSVVRNVSSVASHAACKIMGNTNFLLETVSSFIELSPYRPFGTYVFCTGNGKLVVLRNPDAVLQLLFYSSQLNSVQEHAFTAQRSIKDHLNYKDELLESLEMQSVTCIDSQHCQTLPLSPDDANIENSMVNLALNDLGLSTRARLCLRAADELEKQKERNEAKINEKMKDIEKGLQKLEEYKNKCVLQKVGYYDAFKISKDKDDFDANVIRLELAGIWDEIIEMLKRYELPDEFECRKAWIEIGTRYRRIVEPLDIANYYRHLKNEDTGPYMEKGRPKRYKCTQRWREHYLRLSYESLESCFWAEVEELSINVNNIGTKESILHLKSKAEKLIEDRDLEADVFLEGSTFKKLLTGNTL